MPEFVNVPLTEREAEALRELCVRLDLPGHRVLIQALRHYQASLDPQDPLEKLPKSEPGLS